MQLLNFKTNARLFPALEFLVQLLQHLPDARAHLVRRHGLYSSRSRGTWSRKQPLRPPMRVLAVITHPLRGPKDPSALHQDRRCPSQAGGIFAELITPASIPSRATLARDAANASPSACPDRTIACCCLRPSLRRFRTRGGSSISATNSPMSTRPSTTPWSGRSSPKTLHF